MRNTFKVLMGFGWFCLQGIWSLMLVVADAAARNPANGKVVLPQLQRAPPRHWSERTTYLHKASGRSELPSSPCDMYPGLCGVPTRNAFN